MYQAHNFRCAWTEASQRSLSEAVIPCKPVEQPTLQCCERFNAAALIYMQRGYRLGGQT
jgi:hypothetical protein